MQNPVLDSAVHNGVGGKGRQVTIKTIFVFRHGGHLMY